MKTLWNIVSFLAVVHLLALVMFVGWLWKSGRLDGARIDELREMLAVLLLPERRPERTYKRHVKIKMSNYKRNPGRTSKPPGSCS